MAVRDLKAYNARYFIEHRDLIAATRARYRADLRAPGCVPTNFDFDATVPFYTEARRLTRETGEEWHVDHVIPLCKGGRHEAANLQVITAEANRLKSRTERRASPTSSAATHSKHHKGI